MPSLRIILFLLGLLVPLSIARVGVAQDSPAETPAEAEEGSRTWATLELADGTRFEGPLLGMSNDGFVLRVDGVAVTVARSLVVSASIEQRVAPTSEPSEEVAWIVIRTTDGAVVSGTLVRQTDEAVVLRVGSEETAIPRDRIDSTAVGVLGGAEAELPSLQTGADLPTEVAEESQDLTRAWEEYRQRRMVMLDHKARRIGPPSLGYRWEDFDRRRNARFHIVFGKRMRTRIRTVEFQDLVADPTFTAAMEMAVDRALVERKAGWAFLAGGAGALLTGVVMNSIGASSSDLSPVLFGGIPLLASGVTFFVVGASLDVKSRKRMESLRGFDFSEVMPRDRAWEAMQRYNGEVRRELGLEDDESLDALEQADD